MTLEQDIITALADPLPPSELLRRLLEAGYGEQEVRHAVLNLLDRSKIVWADSRALRLAASSETGGETK